MHHSSKILESAIDEISQLPGIGRRAAMRLALHMLNTPKTKTDKLTSAILELVHNIKHCKHCNNLSDTDICEICLNSYRNKSIVCVVEDVRDVMAIEATQQYNGLYHVIGGKISPIEGVSPSDLFIESLIDRVRKNNIEEIIFALSSTVEGDTTMFYIYKILSDFNIQFSIIARGIGVGEELEYTDELTLVSSINNRVPYSNKTPI